MLSQRAPGAEVTTRRSRELRKGPPSPAPALREREPLGGNELLLPLFTRKGVNLKNNNKNFLSKAERLEELHSFKQGFDKFMIDLSIMGNYSEATPRGAGRTLSFEVALVVPVHSEREAEAVG